MFTEVIIGGSLVSQYEYMSSSSACRSQVGVFQLYPKELHFYCKGIPLGGQGSSLLSTAATFQG